MTKILNHPIYRFVNLILAWYLLSGCAAVNHAMPVQGDVWGLYYGSARYIIDGALNYEPLTKIYANPERTLFVFARPIADGWGWIVLDSKHTLADLKFACGNFSCPNTWGDLVKWMTDNGWTVVGGGLTAQVRAAVSAIGSVELVPIFFVLPVDVDPADFFLPESLQAGGTIDG